MAPKVRDKQRSTRLRYTVLAAVIIIVSACACLVPKYGLPFGTRLGNQQREPEIEQAASREWAQPLELPGVPNLHKVCDELYRGAQPTAEGMKQLQKLGIKTVVNLRFLISDHEELKGTTLAYEHIHTTTFHARTEDVVRFLKIVTDPNRTPVFVHCQHGADRTGTMCAAYRVTVQDWSKDEAIKEMTQGGFGHHMIWKNLVEFIRTLDIDEIKRAAGLSNSNSDPCKIDSRCQSG